MLGIAVSVSQFLSLIFFLCISGAVAPDPGSFQPGLIFGISEPVCENILPDFPLPESIFRRQQADSLTLQQICAAPYFGGLTGISLNAFCYDKFVKAQQSDENIFLGKAMAFRTGSFQHDVPDAAVRRARISFTRLQMYCMRRCRCSSRGIGSYYPWVRGDLPWITRDDDIHYVFRLDGPGSRTSWHHSIALQNTIELSHPMPSDVMIVETLVDRPHAIWDMLAFRQPARTTVSLSLSNAPLCIYPTFLPINWAFPHNIPWEAFNEAPNPAQYICASAFHGGKEKFNAGATCVLRSYGTGETQKVLRFSDELTPDVTWLPQRNWRFALAIRSFCQQACSCSGNRGPDPEAFYRQINLLRGGHPELHEDGAEWVGTMADGQTEVRYTLVESALILSAPHQPQQQCAQQQQPDGSCPTEDQSSDRWPEELFGPIPRASPKWNADSHGLVLDLDAALVKQHSSLTGSNRKCGGECRAQRDCASPSGGDRCVCQAESAEKGLTDRLATFAFASCMTLLSGRRKRSAPAETDRSCVCNATYVSLRCCSSDDGIVWEDHSRRLGVLSD